MVYNLIDFSMQVTHEKHEDCFGGYMLDDWRKSVIL